VHRSDQITISLSPVATRKFQLAANFKLDVQKLASGDVDEIYPLHELLPRIVAFEFSFGLSIRPAHIPYFLNDLIHHKFDVFFLMTKIFAWMPNFKKFSVSWHR
jgi:hypothetical protein